MSISKLSKDLFKEYIKESTIDKPFFNKLIEDIEGRIPSDVKFHKEMKEGNTLSIFEKQINYGGPVTVDNKNSKRNFLTINQAVNLIIDSVKN